MRRKKLPSAPAEGFHFDEKNHLYFFDGKPMTGCTTILGVLAKPALIPWAAKMAVEHIVANCGKCAEFSEGSEPYHVFPQDLEEARTAHAKKRDTAADAGTALHALVEEYVRLCVEVNEGKPNADPGTDYDAIAPFYKWAIKENIRFRATEQRLYSKVLWVAGTADLIFEKDGRRYVGDVKTFKKIWDKVPLIQCAGYALMWEEMRKAEVEEKVGQRVDFAGSDSYIDGHCIICLPKERAFDESQDVLWSHDTDGDREAFISCVRLYRYLNIK